MTDKWEDNPYELFVLPPKETGLLDQFWTTGWKFLSRRFGLYGNAVQISHNTPEVVDIAQASAARQGEKMRRRMQGKNGWLWFSISRRDARIRDLEWEMAKKHVPIPYPPKWYHKLILRLFWGYRYERSWYTWEP